MTAAPASQGHDARRIVIAACLLVMMCAPAAAQSPADARPVRRVEASVGGGLLGGAALAQAEANLRANRLQPEAHTLFTTTTRFAAAPVIEARVGVAVTRRISVEARVAFARPELRTSVAEDVEDVPPLTVVERIDQYVVEGGVLILIDELRLTGVVPFVAAGAGYLRQLHEGLTMIEEGHVYHVGGGVKHWLFARQRGALRAAGLRADARLYLLVGGYTLQDRARPHGAISASMFVTF